MIGASELPHSQQQSPYIACTLRVLFFPPLFSYSENSREDDKEKPNVHGLPRRCLYKPSASVRLYFFFHIAVEAPYQLRLADARERIEHVVMFDRIFALVVVVLLL